MADDRVVLTKGERVLPVRLSDERQIELAHELAENVRRLERMKEIHAGRKKEMREEEQIEQAGISEVSGWLHNGAEPKTVPVEWVADFPSGRKELIRTDTGEVVETAELEDADRQTLLGDAPVETGPRRRSRSSTGGRKRAPVGEVEDLPDEPGEGAGAEA
jgi:hypothetical protein